MPGGHGRSARQVLLNHLEQIRLAEALGFHSAWVAEHHFSDYGLVNDPLVYLSAAAAQTSRIRLGAGVVVVPLHHPIRLAENAAWVDTLSGGRLDVGIGRGYQPHEFAAFDVDMEEAQARTEEAMSLVQAAWTQDEVNFDGKFFKAHGITLVPKPVQKPHPPIFTAAVSPSTFERLGKVGQQILTSPNFTPLEMIRDNFDAYRSALATGGFDAHDYDFPLMQQVYVGSDAQSAYDEPQRAAMQYYRLLGRLLPKNVKNASPADNKSYDFYSKVRRNVENLEYDFLYNNGVCFGDAGRVVELIQRLEEEVGITYFQCWFNFGGLDHETAMASMRRFGERVMPQFDVEQSHTQVV